MTLCSMQAGEGGRCSFPAAGRRAGQQLHHDLSQPRVVGGLKRSVNPVALDSAWRIHEAQPTGGRWTRKHPSRLVSKLRSSPGCCTHSGRQVVRSVQRLVGMAVCRRRFTSHGRRRNCVRLLLLPCFVRRTSSESKRDFIYFGHLRHLEPKDLEERLRDVAPIPALSRQSPEWLTLLEEARESQVVNLARRGRRPSPCDVGRAQLVPADLLNRSTALPDGDHVLVLYQSRTSSINAFANSLFSTQMMICFSTAAARVWSACRQVELFQFHERIRARRLSRRMTARINAGMRWTPRVRRARYSRGGCGIHTRRTLPARVPSETGPVPSASRAWRIFATSGAAGRSTGLELRSSRREYGTGSRATVGEDCFSGERGCALLGVFF